MPTMNSAIMWLMVNNLGVVAPVNQATPMVSRGSVSDESNLSIWLDIIRTCWIEPLPAHGIHGSHLDVC